MNMFQYVKTELNNNLDLAFSSRKKTFHHKEYLIAQYHSSLAFKLRCASDRRFIKMAYKCCYNFELILYVQFYNVHCSVFTVLSVIGANACADSIKSLIYAKSIPTTHRCTHTARAANQRFPS